MNSRRKKIDEPLIDLAGARTELLWKRLAWVLIGLTLVVRLINLGADPPLGLTTSQGVYTDPGAYTLSARNDVLYGESNPLGDNRFPLFQYSAIAAVARLVFGVAGSGYTQANFVGVLFSSLTILLLFSILAKTINIRAGIFALTLLLFNENQYHYGRLPFLENAMILFGVLSLWLMVVPRNKGWTTFIAGTSLAACILLGKAHGVIFVGAFVVYFLWKHFSETNEGSRIVRKANIDSLLAKFPTSAFVTGGIVFLILWLAAIGWDNLNVIITYIREQSTGIYGPPEGFESLRKFLRKIINLGVASELFWRMPAVTIAGALGLFYFVYKFIQNKFKPFRDQLISKEMAFMVSWFIIGYLVLSPWNYRPLRYQITLIYPACALAGIFLYGLWTNTFSNEALEANSSEERHWSLRGAVIFAIILSVLLWTPIHELMYRISESHGYDFTYSNNFVRVVASSSCLAGAALGAILYLNRRKKPLALPPALFQYATLTFLALSLANGVIWYKDWLVRPTYTIKAVSRDIGMSLGQSAVISGPYGVGLTQDNRIRAIVHMFGVADPDTSFFRNFPVTHLLLDRPNYDRFEKMYPAVADSAVLIHSYRITNRKVELYRVAGFTGNRRADSYKLSLFEGSIKVLKGEMDDPQGTYLGALARFDTANIALNLIMSKQALDNGQYRDAEFFLLCAISACPTDYNLWADLGRLQSKMFEKFKDESLRAEAKANFSRALELNPNSSIIEGEYEKLLNLNF